MEKEIDKLIHLAIQKHVFPGAVVLVGDQQKTIFQRAYGTTRYVDRGSVPVAADMIFDLASITKVFTATLILQLVDAGKFNLATEVGKLVPGLEPSEKAKITIFQLLTHSSGLSLKFHSFRDFPSKSIRWHLLHDKLAYRPGSQVVYDNANAMMLAEVITNVTKIKFINYLKAEILDPMDLKNTKFKPAKKELPRIVPTENCSWRNRLIHGQVHDESAFAMGGISGHAGLFSTASDLWKFATMWLNNGVLGKKTYLSAEIIRQATTPQTKWEFGPIGLEWKIDNFRLMDHAPKGTYGHAGFTGTSLVISPRKEKIIILLSNRIYPHRPPDDRAIYEVRRKLAGIVLN